MRKKEEEEEETRPYLRCGDAVRSQQAKVTINSSIRGNSRKRCRGGARMRSGKLIRWVGPRWVHVPINARTSMCQPFCINLGKKKTLGEKAYVPSFSYASLKAPWFLYGFPQVLSSFSLLSLFI